jgi:pimeloyl-ACP methyl ester carboxylesterase
VLPRDHRLDLGTAGVGEPDQRRAPVRRVRHRLDEPAPGRVVHHPLHELTDGGQLAYRNEGTGPLVVLLHGGFLDHRQWTAQLDTLPARYRVVAPDARGRGHGDSTNAEASFRHTDDVATLIRHLDAGPAVLIGVSMGAATATDTALEHPELVRALVVSGAGTSGPDRALSDLDPAIPALIAEMTVKTWMKHTADEQDWSTHAEDTWARAAKLTIPVLAVIGGSDSDDHRDNAERLADSVACGRNVTIDDAAHYPNMEHAAEFDAIVTEFVGALPQ